MIETLKSTEVLTKEGFKVMVYCNDDPLMAKRLENAGASAIMPLAAPIGSGLGILNKVNIKILRNQTKLPLIIDAGLGMPMLQLQWSWVVMEYCKHCNRKSKNHLIWLLHLKMLLLLEDNHTTQEE